MNIADVHFGIPYAIGIGLLISAVLVWLFSQAEKDTSIHTAAAHDMGKIFGIGRGGNILRYGLLCMICALFTLIFAKPYQISSDIEIKKDGIDVVIVMDISGSMDFPDFEPSRMEVAKATLQDFVSEVSSDRLGLIVFAGKPISSQPLTFDYPIITETLASLSTEIINQQIPGLSGTNIGDALLLSQNMFDLPDREKIIILVTDGDANSGADPVLTAEILKQKNIIIYPVGIGKDAPSEVMINNGFFTQKQTVPALNTTTLQNLADITGGVFFRAGDPSTLKAIFKKLEGLQTSEITTNVKQHKTNYYTPFVYALLILLSILVFIELIYPRCR